jgi:hypothetical protein
MRQLTGPRMGRAERGALRQDVNAFLGELGGTASEIAVGLHALGVRVRPERAGGSAAVRYMQLVIGADPRVRRVKVTRRRVALKTYGRWPSIVRVGVPHPVRQFVAAVDAAAAAGEEQTSYGETPLGQLPGPGLAGHGGTPDSTDDMFTRRWRWLPSPRRE